MFIPYPSWFFPIPGPFSARALIEDTKHNTGIITSHFGDIHNLRAIPIWRMRDTPLRSVYRLYELHLADHYELMGWMGDGILLLSARLETTRHTKPDRS